MVVGLGNGNGQSEVMMRAMLGLSAWPCGVWGACMQCRSASSLSPEQRVTALWSVDLNRQQGAQGDSVDAIVQLKSMDTRVDHIEALQLQVLECRSHRT